MRALIRELLIELSGSLVGLVSIRTKSHRTTAHNFKQDKYSSLVNDLSSDGFAVCLFRTGAG